MLMIDYEVDVNVYWERKGDGNWKEAGSREGVVAPSSLVNNRSSPRSSTRALHFFGKSVLGRKGPVSQILAASIEP